MGKATIYFFPSGTDADTGSTLSTQGKKQDAQGSCQGKFKHTITYQGFILEKLKFCESFCVIVVAVYDENRNQVHRGGKRISTH